MLNRLTSGLGMSVDMIPPGRDAGMRRLRSRFMRHVEEVVVRIEEGLVKVGRTLSQW